MQDGLLSYIKHKNLIAMNYAGKEVINCAGLLIFLPLLLSALLSFLIQPNQTQLVFALMIPILTFIGMLDDLLGDSSAKGLIGHANVIRNGGFSTGFLKALVGGILGLLLAWIRYQSLLIMALDIFIFALSVNTINLLDLRPGRAIKGFGLILLIMAAMAKFAEINFIFPTIIILLLYIRGELKEIYMLGDTGANLLGGILGFYGVIVLQPITKGILLTLLFSLHLLSEFVSISKLIEETSWLYRLDMLGRNKKRS